MSEDRSYFFNHKRINQTLYVIYQNARARFRTDFQLYVLAILNVFFAIALIPFIIFRYKSGDMLIFFLEIGLLLLTTFLFLYAWLSGNSTKPAIIVASLSTFGIIVAIQLIGATALYWFFCSIVISFALVTPKKALILTSCGLCVIYLLEDLFLSPHDKMTFFTSALCTTFFGAIVALRNFHQQKLLIQIARTDPLTDASNRRAYNEELCIALIEYKRHKTSFTLFSFDVDHFKKINDRYGHDVGDLTLVGLVAVVRKNVRPQDRLFRIGGEEFCLLVRNIQPSKIHLFANKILRIISEEEMVGGKAITVSLGIATINEVDDVTSWQNRADKALYQAKANGRNRFVFDDN